MNLSMFLLGKYTVQSRAKRLLGCLSNRRQVPQIRKLHTGEGQIGGRRCTMGKAWVQSVGSYLHHKTNDSVVITCPYFRPQL